jgi:hypothetical protein
LHLYRRLAHHLHQVLQWKYPQQFIFMIGMPAVVVFVTIFITRSVCCKIDMNSAKNWSCSTVLSPGSAGKMAHKSQSLDLSSSPSAKLPNDCNEHFSPDNNKMELRDKSNLKFRLLLVFVKTQKQWKWNLDFTSKNFEFPEFQKLPSLNAALISHD